MLLIASISGAIAVGLGAFGAHGLKKILSPEMLEVYKTGVLYHFIHTLALVAVALLLEKADSNILHWGGYLFFAGILLFSGSLYVLSITGIKVLGAITPFGGLAFMGGWICLAVYAYKEYGV